MTTCCIKFFLVTICLGGFNILFAQNDITVYLQPELGFSYKVKEGYSHFHSLQIRNYGYRDNEVQLKTRQIDLVHFSNWKLNLNQSLALGIQYRFREVFEPESENELRLVQQYNGSAQKGTLRFGHRLRAEQRISPSLTRYRFRYRFAIDLPLNGEKLDVGEAYLVASTEALHTSSRGRAPSFDQRLTSFIGWQISPEAKWQVGLEYRAEDYFKDTETILFLLSSLVFSL
jgi:hypothetical protein